MDAGYPPRGGAQISLLSLLYHLKVRGHPVLYLDRARPGGRRHLQRWGIPCSLFRDLEEFKQILTQARPSLVIASLGAIPPALALADSLKAPLVAYLQSFEFCPPDRRELHEWQTRDDRNYPARDTCRSILKQASRIWVNSHFLQARVTEQHGLESQVVYPEILPQHLPRRRDGDAIVGVCGYPYKGSEIFLDLAQQFPEQKFLLAGALHPDTASQLRSLSNVEHWPFVENGHFLRRARLLLVPSQWPEPFGRVAVEAFACRIPCLASHCGGLPEIVGQGVADFRSPEAWRQALGHWLLQPGFTERPVQQFLQGRSALAAEEALGAPPPGNLRVTRLNLQGATDQLSAFSRIARCWKTMWSQSERYQLVEELPDQWIHLDFCQDFGSLTLPPTGYAVALRTWDFGPYPLDWAQKICRDFDQLWVFSHWTRACAIRSQIPESRIRVVPPGFDPSVFFPRQTRPHHSTRFLFVGAPIHRKGFDILLKAWKLAFQPHEPVTLVLKLHSRDVFYQGILQEVKITSAAPIEVVDEELSPIELAELMATCDFGVFPYRAEGFALPIVESMACGVPCLIPRFGASLDYCGPENSLQLPVQRICLPVTRAMAYNTLGFEAQIDEVDFCEMLPQVLAEGLRKAATMPVSERLRLAGAAAESVHQAFTWEHSLARAEACLQLLEGQGPPLRLRSQRSQALRQQRRLEAARSLFRNSLDSSESNRRQTSKGLGVEG